MSGVDSKAFTDRVCQYTSRLVCIGCLCCFGVFVAQAVSARSGPRSATLRADSTTSDGENRSGALSSALSFMPDAGYWSFPESELSVQRSRCSDSELDERLSRISQITSAPTSHDATHLMSLAKSNGATQAETAAGTLWSLDNSDLRLRLLTSDSESPMLVAAVVATRAEDGWDSIRLQSRPEAPAGQNLLPLPGDAMPSCSRRSEAGELSMQLVSTTATARQLLGLWIDAGWEIRHTPWGDPSSFSYLCVRNDEVVYAWSAESATPRTLMLTRTTPSDRGTDK